MPELQEPTDLDLLRCPLPAFETYAKTVEELFADGLAVWYYTNRTDAFEVMGFGDGVPKFDALGDSLTAFSQFALFAFEEAPDEVIVAWASAANRKVNGDEIVAKVQRVRELAPVTAREWLAKRSAVAPALNDIEKAMSMDDRSNSILSVIALETIETDDSPKGTPLPGSMKRLRFSASRNDLLFLRLVIDTAIDHMAATLAAKDDDELEESL